MERFSIRYYSWQHGLVIKFIIFIRATGVRFPSAYKNYYRNKIKRLSAKAYGSYGQWSWVSVNVFPLSHVDHVANGPGYL